MIRFLGLAIFAGWVFAAGVADAQRYDPSNNMAWPQTPEIGDNPPPVNNRRTPSRLPTDAWPGTDSPQPGIPPRTSEDTPTPAARSQSAPSGSQDASPAAQSAQEAQQRGPARSERTDAIGRPETNVATTASPVLPPMPHRNMAPAMQARAAIAETSPAASPAVGVAEQPPSAPQLPAPVVQAEPAPAPVPTPVAAEAPAPQPAPTVAVAEPVETAAPVSPPAPAPQPETQTAAVQAAEPVTPTTPAVPVSESAASVAPSQPEPAPAEPESAPTQPVPGEAPAAAAVPAQPVASEVPAVALAEPSEAPADKAPAAEVQQQVAVAPAAPAEPATPADGAAPAAPSEPQPAPQAKADDGLTKLIGQMIVVGFEGTEPGDPGVTAVIDQLRKGRVGGVVVASRNIRSARQLKALTAALRDAGGTSPLLMIAHEGGAGQAMTPEKGFSAYPSAAALGRANDPLNAFSVYQYMAEELAAYGFNVNLGPVVDLDPATKIDEAAVEGRSYGVVPKHVAAFAKAFRLAHHQKSILTALKHFPPLAAGAAPADIDAAAADPLNTFRELIESDDADMVMTSNLPSGDGTGDSDLPPTLSEGLVKTQLRGQLGYDGVVLSGDLQATELAGRWGLEERVTRAVAAGNDILLAGIDNPPSPDLAAVMAAAIANAVEKGTLAREALDAAGNRIGKLKASIGNSANAIASADGKSQEKPASR